MSDYAIKISNLKPVGSLGESPKSFILPISDQMPFYSLKLSLDQEHFNDCSMSNQEILSKLSREDFNLLQHSSITFLLFMLYFKIIGFSVKIKRCHFWIVAGGSY